MPDADGLLTPVDIQRLLADHGFAPRKSAGQNFVSDPNTVRRIVAAADLAADTTVVEIGPGLGSLTHALVPVAGRVIVVEIDTGFSRLLREEFGDAIEVVEADALKLTWSDLVSDAVLVSNLPYNIATPLVMEAALAHPAIRRQFVMVQREVGERWQARVGDAAYGAVSVKLALLCERVEIAFAISRQVFIPVPNVDSVMVHLVHRDVPRDEVVRWRLHVVDTAFTQRRKTLRNNLKAVADVPAIEAACASLGIDPSARAETLDADQHRDLADLLRPDGEPEAAAS